MNKYILVIDIGTQSLRASIVSSTGEIMAISKRKYEVPYLSPEKGFAEQDVEYYLNEMAKATNNLYDDHSEYMNSVSGVVVDVFRDSSVILDENKKPIRNAILWMDQRVTKLNMKNHTWYERLLFRVIGMTDTVKYNAERTATFWLMEHEKENWARMKYYCPLGAYFNYVMTGRLAVSSADCIGHYPMNFKKGKWLGKNNIKQNVFKIPFDSHPELVPVGDIIGNITEDFSKISKIPAGLPLFACGSDKACETFGNGCIDKTSASISLGTACTVEVVDTKYSEPEKFLPSYQAPYKGSYNLEVQIYCGLWMVKWFVDNFAHEEKIEAERSGVSVESILNEKIKDIPAGSDGLVLQPYWQPGLKRPNSKGSMVGFSNIHTKYHIYKAIYEGLAFALRDGLDEIVKKTHKKPDYLVISGGGSQSKELCQIIADVFNLRCVVVDQYETSTIGSAMAGFMDLGVFKNAKEAKENMCRFGNNIYPNEINSKIYNKLYKTVYLKMYPSLKKVYQNNKNFYLETEMLLNSFDVNK